MQLRLTGFAALAATAVLAAGTGALAQINPRLEAARQPAVTAAVASPQVTAQNRLVPFEEFQASIPTEQAAKYLARPDLRVRVASDFEAMRQHLQSLYAPLKVTHSFALETDIYDCIPLMQQPSVRLMGITRIADVPPPLPQPAAGPAVAHLSADEMRLHAVAQPQALAQLPTAGAAVQVGAASAVDRFGNSTRCEAGSIPMRRVTLEEMSRFHTLQDFFNKGASELAPTGPGANIPPCGGASCLHKYSVFHQAVSNWGGNSTINVWSPSVDTSKDEAFSLTQQWYVGGSGASLPGLQTVEIGWQNYPQKYGDQRSRLFIYHTADGYNHTGCYNLDCSDFVQTDNSVYIGGGFTNYSTAGGGQWEMAIQVQFYKGNWWLFYGGKPFGYYPGSLFHGGALTHAATDVEYGTETTGSSIWPPAGSGGQPALGWSRAAYQKNLFYISTSGGGVWENLSTLALAPCYALNGPSSGGGSGWQVYFYDGGAGGKSC
ncbi:MAG TPA: neprosin family prolyl endopeptidase [Caulobacteraceae bacterium]|jgi:hypothetical protein|nr:neprosin family prolyl endopeptidase [Caulobacteraceae bacterium]